ncbi:MAG: quinone-dependent dihydroorotate dehydrogenase [Bacteroidales bacterium]|nr:quinone-dependent dihydroorotate dehydrogenase [Candidatus Egerieousia equi]
MYRLIRPLLFLLSPESAHKASIYALKALSYIPLGMKILSLFFNFKSKALEREVFGIKFKNPVGLSAGFDKNGDLYNLFAPFGFSFIEIGSLTPLPQDGNPRPRCFRLESDNAIINRMGINNRGVKYAVQYIKEHKPDCIIGANLSKNATVANENAADDYERSFSLLYDFVDYFVINVSCPNVKDLTKLQDIGNLSRIIDRLLTLRNYYDDYRPILLKISPDLSFAQMDEIIDLVLLSGLDGVVATNTTTSRANLETNPEYVRSIGNGGLSGKPLFKRSLEVVRYIHEKTNGILPIIASGGIMKPEDAKAMLDAGASLVQVYSGFIYNGPSFVRKINKYLSEKAKEK